MVASFTSIRVTNCKRRWIISVSEIHTPLTPSSDPRFNMPHDDSNKCKEDGVKVQQHVMAPMLNYYTNPWMWSKCSRKYITEFLEYVLLFLFFLPPPLSWLRPLNRYAAEGFFFPVNLSPRVRGKPDFSASQLPSTQARSYGLIYWRRINTLFHHNGPK